MTEGREDARFEAARSGDTARLWTLLDASPDRIDAPGDHGMTLLHVAAESDHLEMATGLLDRGADPAIRADWGQTPFEYAANMNSRRVAKLLLERGAAEVDLWTAAALGDVDAVGRYFENGRPPPGSGRSPRDGAVLDHWPADSAFRSGDEVSDAFYIACRNGNREVAELLLEHGADVEALGYFGATALQWAAGKGQATVVEWLISRGADPLARDPRFGGTAAGWAREFGHEDLATWIEANGGSE